MTWGGGPVSLLANIEDVDGSKCWCMEFTEVLEAE